MPKVKPKPAPLPWPERVKALLERYDLTQAELGERLGYSQSNVNKVIKGIRVPSNSMRKLLELMEAGETIPA